MRTNLVTPMTQVSPYRQDRRDATAEALGALAIETSTAEMGPAAARALTSWSRQKADDATLIACVNHLHRSTDTDNEGLGCLAARYAIAVTHPITLPASFATLCDFHRRLFDWRGSSAGTPRSEALADDDGIQRSTDLISNREPRRIPKLADVAFRCIEGGSKLIGLARPDFVGLIAEFATDLLLLAPFSFGNGITLRLLLTLLGQAAGHPLAFRGATRARVLDAFSSALRGEPASLVQLLDASLRSPASEGTGALPSVRDILLSNGDVGGFAAALAKRHAITDEPAPIDAFTAAVSRLSDAEVRPDTTQDLLTALGRAGVLTGHDVTMLLAAHLRQQG